MERERRRDEEPAAGTWINSHTERRESNAVRAEKAQHSGAHAKPTLESLY